MISSNSRKVAELALAAVIFNGVSGILAARALGTLQFSAFAAALVIVTTLQIFFQGLQFSSEPNQETHSQEESIRKNQYRYFAEGLTLTGVVGLIVFTSRASLNVTTFQCLVICMMVLPGLAISSVAGFFLSQDDFVNYQKLATINASFRFGLSLILFMAGLYLPLLRSPAMFIGLLIISSYLSLFFIKRKIPKSAFFLSRIIKKQSWISVVSVSAGWLLVQGDLILFNAVLPADQAGKVSAYSSIAKILISFVALIAMILDSKERKAQEVSSYSKIIFSLFAIALSFAVVSVLTGKFLITLLYGSTFVIQPNAVPLLVFSNSIWAVFSGMLYIRLKREITFRTSVTLVILLAGSILGCYYMELTYTNILLLSSAAGILGVVSLSVPHLSNTH